MVIIRYVRSQVRLDLSEDDACAAFELELESCYRDNSKKIDETGRRINKALSRDDTIVQTELLRQARACSCACFSSLLLFFFSSFLLS